MKCTKCGATFNDGSKFCSECGATAEVNESVVNEPEQSSQPVMTPYAEVTNENTEPAQPLRPVVGSIPPVNKRNKKKSAIIVGAVLLVLIVIAAISGGKVNMEDYIYEDNVVAYKGANGSGEISYYYNIIDFDGLATELFGTTDYQDYFKISKNSDGITFFSGTQNISSYISVEYDAEKNGKLENGDKIKFTITVDAKSINKMENIEKKLKSKKTYTLTVEVEGLNEMTEIDVFDGVDSVSFSTYFKTSEVEFKSDYSKQYGNLTVQLQFSDSQMYIVDETGETLVTFFFEIADFDVNNPPAQVEVTVTNTVDAMAYYGIRLAKSSQTVDVITK